MSRHANRKPSKLKRPKTKLGLPESLTLPKVTDYPIRFKPVAGLSSDNDPLYRFHQWQANLQILEVTEIKSVPYVPLSHPFVERLISAMPIST